MSDLPQNKRRPIAIDLFSGAGGLSLGFEQAGFDVVAAVEYDPIHAAIHELNFPKCSVICASVIDLTGDDIRRRAGLGDERVDVVIGGPPCQGFSLIGHRILEDPRNSLVFHFLRLVSELRPKMFLMENVPGMATGRHHQLLDELINEAGKAGYDVVEPYKILNAANYGVPQNRRRLFLMGSRKDQTQPIYPTPTTRLRVANESSISKTSATQAALPLATSAALPLAPSVEDALGDLPDIELFETLRTTDLLRLEKRSAPSPYAGLLRNEVLDPYDFSAPRLFDPQTVTGCARAEHTPLSRSRFEVTQPGQTEPISRFFRLPPSGLSNTLRAGTATDRGAFSAPRPIHPTFARCISVREAARLHSYPDWFRFHRTIWHGFRQIGNSVPPFLGRAVGSAFMKALATKPMKPTEPVALGPENLAHLTMKDAAAHFGVESDTIAARQRRVKTA